MKKPYLPLLLLLLPFLILSSFISNFIYHKDAVFTDLSITFLPNALFINNSIFNLGTFPLWTNSILCGYPFSADTQSGLWYLPMWLVNLLPSAFTFNILIFVHLFMAGVGMFLFLKREGLHDSSALVGGFLFELTPKIWAHFGSGHISLVMAVCWTPWLLLAEHEFFKSGYSRRRFVFPGIVLGLIILCNITWAPYAALLWIAYAFILHLQGSERENYRQKSLHAVRRLGWFFVQGLSALLISAPIWLPLITFSNLSSRSLMTQADRMVYSMPFINILNLFLPNFNGLQEWEIYSGIITLFFILYLLLSPHKHKLSLFWVIINCICLLISFGSNLPLIPLLYKLPLFNLLRVPSRFFFIACLGTAILAAFGMEVFLTQHGKTDKLFRLSWIGFGLLISTLSIGFGILKQDLTLQYLWPSIFFLLSLILVFQGYFWGKGAGNALQIIITVFVCLDVFGVDLLSLDMRSTDEVLTQNSEIVEYITSHDGLFRTYSPSYSLQQQTAAKSGIQLADGVNPLQLISYVEFMEDATGIPITHYTGTMPDFLTGNPETDNTEYTPNTQLLGVLNVRYVLSAFELPESHLLFIKRLDNTFIYENPEWLPRAWVQREAATIGTKIISTPEINLSANKVILSAKGPGLLVLSEIAYPGWHVFVDGKEDTLLEPLGLLRGVDLSPGAHEVEFIYQPLDVWIGLVLAGAGWIAALVLVIVKPRKEKRPH